MKITIKINDYMITNILLAALVSESLMTSKEAHEHKNADIHTLLTNNEVRLIEKNLKDVEIADQQFWLSVHSIVDKVLIESLDFDKIYSRIKINQTKGLRLVK